LTSNYLGNLHFG